MPTVPPDLEPPAKDVYRVRVVAADGTSVTSEVFSVERKVPVTVLTLRAEVGCHALWSIDEHGDPDAFDPAVLTIKDDTRAQLEAWTAAFDAAHHGSGEEAASLLHGGEEPPPPGFATDEAAQAFQEDGARLCATLNEELQPAYRINYSPAAISVAPKPKEHGFLLKAERGCTPLWSTDDSGDLDALDLDLLKLTDATKARLHKWAADFDATANDDDPAAAGFATQEAADAFEREGQKLVAIVQRELGKPPVVTYQAVEMGVAPEKPKQAFILKAERGCTPLWTLDESGDHDALDVDLLKLTDATKKRLHDWAAAFDATANDDDPASSGFASPEAASSFETEGYSLLEQLRQELGDSIDMKLETIALPVAPQKAKPSFILKAERGCTALWSLDESGDHDALDLELLALSDKTKARLQKWSDAFDATANGDDPANSGFKDEAAVSAFRSEGTKLLSLIQKELGATVLVAYDDAAELPIAVS